MNEAQLKRELVNRRQGRKTLQNATGRDRRTNKAQEKVGDTESTVRRKCHVSAASPKERGRGMRQRQYVKRECQRIFQKDSRPQILESR